MTKNRYSDLELEQFKSMIDKKMLLVNEQCAYLKSSIDGSDSNGIDDTSSKIKMLEDGAEALSKEEMNILYNKQLSLKRDLEFALYKIEVKTYGVCVNTGDLIPKERLKAIPQALTIIKK